MEATKVINTYAGDPELVGAHERVEEFASLNSVEAKQTAKGEWQVSVKQYGQDLGEICDQAGEMAERAIKSLQAKNLPVVGS